ncbi:ABC transporter permease [uncultured Devosia sp.]|uniref:ABC transporter permease n=1 Tax=uncultured Devosia sp. TaxID=211434 RepID=UPI0035CBA71B
MTVIAENAEPLARRASKPVPNQTAVARIDWNWLGAVPYFAFTALFMILPIFYIFIGAFQTPEGSFTLQNILDLASPTLANSYWLSIRLSLASAAIGTVFGLALAYAVILGGMPTWMRHAFTTFSGVAANFAGVPLAFAFIATLGRLGLVTIILRDVFGINIYSGGFTLFSFWGLALTYLYFQLPLMLLVITPALEGLKTEWREAAEILGASRMQYWRMVGVPILAPSVLGCFLLLFANAFGTLATVIALTGSNFSVVPIVLFQQIRGNVLYNPNLGYALAFGMVVIMAVSNILYLMLRARAERWQK